MARIKPVRIIIAVSLAAAIFALGYVGVLAFYAFVMEPELTMSGARAFAAANVALYVAITGTAVMGLTCWIMFSGCGGGHLVNSIATCVSTAALEAGVESFIQADGLGPMTAIAGAMKFAGAIYGALLAKGADLKTEMAVMTAAAD